MLASPTGICFPPVSGQPRCPIFPKGMLEIPTVTDPMAREQTKANRSKGRRPKRASSFSVAISKFELGSLARIRKNSKKESVSAPWKLPFSTSLLDQSIAKRRLTPASDLYIALSLWRLFEYPHFHCTSDPLFPSVMSGCPRRMPSGARHNNTD